MGLVQARLYHKFPWHVTVDIALKISCILVLYIQDLFDIYLHI